MARIVPSPNGFLIHYDDNEPQPIRNLHEEMRRFARLPRSKRHGYGKRSSPGTHGTEQREHKDRYQQFLDALPSDAAGHKVPNPIELEDRITTAKQFDVLPTVLYHSRRRRFATRVRLPVRRASHSSTSDDADGASAEDDDDEIWLSVEQAKSVADMGPDWRQLMQYTLDHELETERAEPRRSSRKHSNNKDNSSGSPHSQRFSLMSRIGSRHSDKASFDHEEAYSGRESPLSGGGTCSATTAIRTARRRGSSHLRRPSLLQRLYMRRRSSEAEKEKQDEGTGEGEGEGEGEDENEDEDDAVLESESVYTGPKMPRAPPAPPGTPNNELEQNLALQALLMAGKPRWDVEGGCVCSGDGGVREDFLESLELRMLALYEEIEAEGEEGWWERHRDRRREGEDESESDASPDAYYSCR